MPRQPSLFEPEPESELPAGFRYDADILGERQQRELVERLSSLEVQPFQFQGWLGKRRVLAFGWKYDYTNLSFDPAPAIPEFLLPLRERAAAFAGLAADRLQQALVTEYQPGAGIGWHRDRPVFGDVVGISLLAPCMLRLRRATATGGWQRASVPLQARSAYLLRGPVRDEWEHSISPMASLRYSVTFRALRA
jgi:alkylated DNA repair dioxygenase AlkB